MPHIIQGVVREILISPERGAPMLSVEQVKVVAGCGLFGDRHFAPRVGQACDKNVTLIESEKIDDFVRSTGVAFSSSDARRNIVTWGIELNALLGCEFRVGPVIVKALELCEPCSLLAKRTNRQVLWGLAHKGGLRCQILSDGTIRKGDVVIPNN